MKQVTKRRFLHCGMIFIMTLAIILAVGWISDWKQQSEETVQLVSERVLIPGGQSVGIRMDVKGVLIVGCNRVHMYCSHTVELSFKRFFNQINRIVRL